MTVWLETNEEDPRPLHGMVNRFAKTGGTQGLTFYEAELVPWLWFLSLGRNIRIFQNLSVIDIVQKIFKDAGYSDFELRTRGSYEPREYCVQYRESNLDFISRLLEEEGLYYFFEHSESKHLLVLTDDNSAMTQCPGPIPLNADGRAFERQDFVRELRHEDAVRVSTVTLCDYDYLQPSLDLRKTVADGPEEIYDWPGKYDKPTAGDRLANLRLEAEEALLHVATGGGFCRSLEAGRTFDIELPMSGDVLSFALIDLSFEFDTGDYRSWDAAGYDGHCEFAAIPKTAKYRPQLRTPRPVVRGSQTALVVGPGGEEIWVDKHGRVKVQFYWDREGQKDENSSCWVRFSTAWAGKGWGQISIPRIGQEVIVDFLEGDPDRPIITGRVYNAEQVIPYTLPDKQTQSGIKSRSTKSGSPETFNEIRMDDEKDKEELYIHAQKNEVIMVENDRTLTVEHDESIKVNNDRTKYVKNDEKTTIDNDRTEKVKNNETIEIGANRSEEVKGNETIKIKGNRDSKIDGTDTLKVGTTLEISAGTSITLKVGSNSIKIDPSGITLKGTMITIQGTAKAEMKAAVVQVNADGPLTLKGAITMIN